MSRPFEVGDPVRAWVRCKRPNSDKPNMETDIIKDIIKVEVKPGLPLVTAYLLVNSAKDPDRDRPFFYNALELIDG